MSMLNLFRTPLGRGRPLHKDCSRHRGLTSKALLFLATLFALPAGAQHFGDSYAVVIGVDRAPNSSFRTLDHAVNDAMAVAEFLRGSGYNVYALYDTDATRKAIIDKLQDVSTKVSENDRVVVFFAGHGHTEMFGRRERGYVVPYDADESTASYISMTDLQDQSENMALARHQLFIMDSCFGGLLGTRGMKVPESRDDYLEAISNRIARQVLTAGGKDQEVADGGADGHSLFTASLLNGMKGNADMNGDGYVAFAELESYVKSTASTRLQTPATFSFPGHEGGEYIFRTSGIRNQSSTSAHVTATTARSVGETWVLYDIRVGGGKTEDCDREVKETWRDYWEFSDPDEVRDFVTDVMAMEAVVLQSGCDGHVYHAELSDGYGATLTPGQHYQGASGEFCRTLRGQLRVVNGTTDNRFLECQQNNGLWESVGKLEDLGLKF